MEEIRHGPNAPLESTSTTAANTGHRFWRQKHQRRTAPGQSHGKSFPAHADSFVVFTDRHSGSQRTFLMLGAFLLGYGGLVSDLGFTHGGWYRLGIMSCTGLGWWEMVGLLQPCVSLVQWLVVLGPLLVVAQIDGLYETLKIMGYTIISTGAGFLPSTQRKVYSISYYIFNY